MSSITGSNTHLVTTLVTDKYNKRSVVCLDIVVDQHGYPGIELLAHEVQLSKHTKGTKARKSWDRRRRSTVFTKG
jgi:hypothetical protein